MCTKYCVSSWFDQGKYAETHLQPSTAKACTTLSNTHFFLWGYNIHSRVYDRRGNKFHAQNQGNLFPFYSLHLPPYYSSFASPVSCRIHSKSLYPMTAFIFPGPPHTSGSPLPSPNCPQSTLHLPWCSPPSLCWAGQTSSPPGAPLPFSPAWTEQSWDCSGLYSSEGHQQ